MAFEITVPRLDWSMERGTFLGWRRQAGEWIRPGEILFELESEKAAQEIEAIDSGILWIGPSAPQPGEVVMVGSVLGYLLAEGEAPPAQSPSAPPNAAAAKAQTATATNGQNAASTETAAKPTASPSVRRLARALGVDLQNVTPTGEHGRITADDVQATAKQQAARPTSPGPASEKTSSVASPRARRVATELGLDWSRVSGTGREGRVREQDVRRAAGSISAVSGQTPANQPLKARAPLSPDAQPLPPRRATIAARMQNSHQQTAPVTLTTRVDAVHLVSLRNRLKAASQQDIPSFTDILVKLVASILPQHEWLAARWDQDHIVLPTAMHIGVAVDTDAGLTVPVVRDAGRLTLSEVARCTRDLVERARQGQLRASELQDGVFSITNLGAYGIDAFTPLINWPEVAILGVGAIRPEAVVHQGQVVAREQVTLSLTFDHRIVDGAPAARFLKALRDAVENPSAFLLFG